MGNQQNDQVKRTHRGLEAKMMEIESHAEFLEETIIFFDHWCIILQHFASHWVS